MILIFLILSLHLLDEREGYSVQVHGALTPAVSGGPHATGARMEKKPVVWPVRSTAWFGWERPVSRGGVLLLPRPYPLVDHPPPCPCSCRYLSTSSARMRRCGGKVSPSALAVFRLSTSSNFMGCSTGRSAGFAPFRMRST